MDIKVISQTDSKVSFQDYQEPLRHRVEKFVESKGLDSMPGLCDNAPYWLNPSGIALIRDDPSRMIESKKILFIFGKNEIRPQRIAFCGIWIDNNKGYSNSKNTPWVIEVYGKDYVEIAKKFANELSAEFDAYIIVKLAGLKPIDI